MFGDYYRGRRVFITGHTGFKGSWLTMWLQRLGAQITGYSIDIPTTPSLFTLANVACGIDHHFGDILDLPILKQRLVESRADIVFHLAAQPLVRLSYQQPLETLSTNVIGTANVLEAARACDRKMTIVAVTSDKCYDNTGSIWGYREIDPMGGHDPYSMSKGAAELVIDSWRNSFFGGSDPVIRLASARAGNVIGGGDWAADRLFSDCVAALIADRAIEIRNPLATRPWQHVLEPLSGYLWLGAQLATAATAVPLASGWNFGPSVASVQPVKEVVGAAIEEWGCGTWFQSDLHDAPHEAFALALNCDKAHQILKWRPAWGFKHTIGETIGWYKAWASGEADLKSRTIDQIVAYENSAATLDIAWAKG